MSSPAAQAAGSSVDSKANGEAGGASTSSKRRARTKWIAAAAIGALLIAGAAFYFVGMSGHRPNHQSRPAKAAPPIFLALEPFTVNLSAEDSDSEGSTRYLHAGLTLQLPDTDMEHQLTVYLPEIRSRILLLLSSKRPAELATVAGKNQLAEAIRQALEKPFATGGSRVKIDSVLFTDFVVQ